MTTTDPRDMVPLADYSSALDEIYMLRAALACEARVTEAHLDLRSFPKSRRHHAVDQVGRMRRASRGQVFLAYSDMSSRDVKECLADAGAEETLTRSQWEAERGNAGEDQS